MITICTNYTWKNSWEKWASEVEGFAAVLMLDEGWWLAHNTAGEIIGEYDTAGRRVICDTGMEYKIARSYWEYLTTDLWGELQKGSGTEFRAAGETYMACAA